LPTRKMKVRIVSYRARLLDKDNLYSGAKCLVDALRRTRLIRDDSPRWLELEVEQEVDRKNQRTEIEVRGLRA
jgi:Holliday junction resolvase RusA-like endonuclease